MTHPCTREGEKFARALADPENGPGIVMITGHRPCICGLPSCDQTIHGVGITIDGVSVLATSPGQTIHGVGITIDGVSVLATSPGAVDGIIEYLRQAAKFAWGQP